MENKTREVRFNNLMEQDKEEFINKLEENLNHFDCENADVYVLDELVFSKGKRVSESN